EPLELILAPDVDVAARPVDFQLMTTSGASDPRDVYWRALCRASSADYDALPWSESTVDRVRIKANYNAGLVAVRGHLGILERCAHIFKAGIRAGLRPNPNRPTFRAGAGWVTPDVGALWGSSQAALTLAIWNTTRRVRELPPTYNYPLHAHSRIDPAVRSAVFA